MLAGAWCGHAMSYPVLLHFSDLLHLALVTEHRARGKEGWLGQLLVGLQQLNGEGDGEKVAVGGVLPFLVQAAMRQFVPMMCFVPMMEFVPTMRFVPTLSVPKAASHC